MNNTDIEINCRNTKIHDAYDYKNIIYNYKELFDEYGKIMYLKVFIDSDDEKLKTLYKNSSIKNNQKLNDNNIDYIDAGFDLFSPHCDIKNSINRQDKMYKLDHKIKCSAQIIKRQHNNNYKVYNTSFYMYPRSSLSKTPLRLANSVGIIDAGYRGNLIAMLDIVGNDKYVSEYATKVEPYDRYIQICAPGLVPVISKIVNSKEELGTETTRGDGGFGSTGK